MNELVCRVRGVVVGVREVGSEDKRFYRLDVYDPDTGSFGRVLSRNNGVGEGMEVDLMVRVTVGKRGDLVAWEWGRGDG